MEGPGGANVSGQVLKYNYRTLACNCSFRFWRAAQLSSHSDKPLPPAFPLVAPLDSHRTNLMRLAVLEAANV